jgi:hypothetical protein
VADEGSGIPAGSGEGLDRDVDGLARRSPLLGLLEADPGAADCDDLDARVRRERESRQVTTRREAVRRPVGGQEHLGSGTTLIAAERHARVCYGFEIDPLYCDVIVAQWERFTGRVAERVDA